MNIQTLDQIYKELNKQLKETEGDSLLGTKTLNDKRTELKVEIVKDIVKTKLEEAQKATSNMERRAFKQKIAEIKALKKDEALHNMSIEELEKLEAEA